MPSDVMYLFGCAAPPVHNIADVIRRAQADGWDVCLGLTPTAASWLRGELEALRELTGHPVRSTYKRPGEPDVWPPADVAVVAPATFNTINQWALGITDHFVVGFAAEAIGKSIPLVAMPCVNLAFTQHPQFERSIETLRGAGVTVLYGPGGFEPHPPGTGSPADYPWNLVLDAAAKRVVRPG
ncbi:flavoprotein [Streptomyces sp. TRM66268-LWL]|uniref:Flavoprotein n=1 Tax=Streptomyces polyasparticus TaxID=2767826 RepID=A0ABR7SSR4_9ACTN|nr:flavoprotein [Streptomyces polyasparticus]MBC9718443.1 flavoprotein [Streptomyces polyasparticus]